MRYYKAEWPLSILNTAYSLVSDGSIIDINTGKKLQGSLKDHTLVEVIGEYSTIRDISVHEMTPKLRKYKDVDVVLGSRKEGDYYTFAVFKYETK